MSTVSLTDEQRKQGELNDILPVEKETVKDAEEAEALFRAKPRIATLGDWNSYFGEHSALESHNRTHRLLVEWYMDAVELWNGINGSFTVYEDETPVYVSFRHSYIGWCAAHQISPEQDMSWNALYSALKAKGIDGFPTLSTFMLTTSTSNSEVKNV